MINPFVYFVLFLKASLFSSGGFSNLPSLHQDLLVRSWASDSQFGQAIAIGQIGPGAGRHNAAAAARAGHCGAIRAGRAAGMDARRHAGCHTRRHCAAAHSHLDHPASAGGRRAGMADRGGGVWPGAQSQGQRATHPDAGGRCGLSALPLRRRWCVAALYAALEWKTTLRSSRKLIVEAATIAASFARFAVRRAPSPVSVGSQCVMENSTTLLMAMLSSACATNNARSRLEMVASS